MHTSQFDQLKRNQDITQQVIELARAGDKEAMAQIYSTYAPRIYNVLFRMLWQRETAQELMQDTFIDVLKNITSYRGESGLYAWIHKIAVNRCLMYFRKHKVTLIELKTEFEIDTKTSTQFKTDNTIDFEKVLQRLTPKRRLIVWLHEVEGMTHKEIAEVMGKSVSFSKTELSRAMEQLRQLTDQSEITDNHLKLIETKDKTEVGLCTPLLNNS